MDFKNSREALERSLVGRVYTNRPHSDILIKVNCLDINVGCGLFAEVTGIDIKGNVLYRKGEIPISSFYDPGYQIVDPANLSDLQRSSLGILEQTAEQTPIAPSSPLCKSRSGAPIPKSADDRCNARFLEEGRYHGLPGN